MGKAIISIIGIAIFAIVGQAQTAISGARWELTELNGRKVTNSRAYMEFDVSASRFSGNAGCNMMFGGYELAGQRFKAKQVGTTRMACTGNGIARAENEFLEALKNAKMDQDWIDKNEVGVLFGNDSSAQPVIEASDIMREKKDTMMVGSASVFKTMNSTVTMNLSTIFKLKGINFTVSAACASGSHAIGLAYLFIKTGLQDCIIAGGAQEINHLSMGNFDALSAFSTFELGTVR